MAFYRDRVLPCLTHLAMSNRRLVDYRRRIVSQARGRVLEVGIGSGLNLPFYGGEVAGVFGIDPSAALLRRAGRRRTAGSELVGPPPSSGVRPCRPRRYGLRPVGLS
jgi:hypothetical protein